MNGQTTKREMTLTCQVKVAEEERATLAQLVYRVCSSSVCLLLLECLVRRATDADSRGITSGPDCSIVTSDEGIRL